jgi:hypothetical protein
MDRHLPAVRHNDIGVTRKDPTAPGSTGQAGKRYCGSSTREAGVVLVWKWDRALREPLDLEYLIPRFDRAGPPTPRMRRGTRCG